ncbi:MAG: TSUP family transporter [Candidatus Lokiarchaeota archaeon]|nr:TSUP family transporter [Candidatus Lokiarchaeota archaeon]
MQTWVNPTISVLLLLAALGFLGGFVDNAFGMGYSLLTPIFLFLGFNPLLVVPTLLLSQTVAGLSGSVFHHLYKNVDFRERDGRQTRIYLLFTGTGVAGAILSATLAVTLPQWFMLLYIGLMLLIVGIIVRFKINFTGGWWKMYAASAIGGFNKAIAGGGYGPLVTSVQIMCGSKVKSSVGTTQFSEATISSIGFIIYYVLNGGFALIPVIQSMVVLVVTGAVAAPMGALLVKRLDEHMARKAVGVSSIILGIITLGRFLLLW